MSSLTFIELFVYFKVPIIKVILVAKAHKIINVCFWLQVIKGDNFGALHVILVCVKLYWRITDYIPSGKPILYYVFFSRVFIKKRRKKTVIYEVFKL